MPKIYFTTVQCSFFRVGTRKSVENEISGNPVFIFRKIEKMLFIIYFMHFSYFIASYSVRMPGCTKKQYCPYCRSMYFIYHIQWPDMSSKSPYILPYLIIRTKRIKGLMFLMYFK